MEDDKRRRKLEAAKEKLAAYKKRKSAQKDAGKISDSEPSFSDTSLSLSPLPLSENDKAKKPAETLKSDSSSISENIVLSNSENDRSLHEIFVGSIPLDSPDTSLKSVLPTNQQNSVLSDSSVISLNALEKFELENNNFLDSSQNVLNELIKQDNFDSLKSNPFDDLSSITLKSERITGCVKKTSQDEGKVNEDRLSEEEMPYKEPVAQQNSTDVESLKEFNSNQSTLSLGTSTTEYKQYYDKVNMGAVDFQDVLSHRDDHIKQLTEALQQVLEDRNNLQEQTDYFAQEIADLKEQLVQTTEIIKKNNWNENKSQLLETETTSLQSLACELKNERFHITPINFDFEDPEFNDSMTPEEKKIVADMRNKINLYILQKVDEYKLLYESEIKILQDKLEYEKNLNKKFVPSFKNTEDSVSTLPSMENNDKIESITENKYEIDDHLFNETFTAEEKEIIADLRTKIFLFIHQSCEKYKTNHELELKVLKDRLENEKVSHDVEIDRLRQLLNSIKSGSTEINELRQELNEQHSKEMEELRTYFEQRCAEIEKHYSEEIFSQQSRKLSNSSISELESEVFPVGPSGDAPILQDSPKRDRDLVSIKLELQNKYHAELEILREDYENRLDEMRITHEQEVKDVEERYQTVIEAMKHEIEEARKQLTATQEVASSGDFEIAEVVESYERRLQEQVMLAKIDIVTALEQQIQTLVSSPSDALEWPQELLQLRDRLTEHWHSEIKEIKEQHAKEIAKLKEDHDKSLARVLERERRNSRNGDEIDLRKERDNLKKATINLRHLVAELIKYFTQCEDELNNTLVEELLKSGWDKESKDSTHVTDSDLNDTSQSGSDHFDTITITPQVKRVHFTPDVTGIIDLINESTVDNTDSKDISSEFRTELDLCLSRLKSEANAILCLTSNLKSKPEIIETPSKPEDRISSLTRQLISETQAKNELNIQIDEFKAYIQNLEAEKQNLEEQLEQMMDKQQVLISELDNAKEKINDLIESGRKEIVSEGYGENQLTGATTLGGRIASLAELQERARSFLAETEESTRHPLLHLVDQLCTESDRIMEDAKKDHEDLVQQIEAADKKLRATCAFLEEQAVEREAERDEAHRQITALQEQLRDAEKNRTTADRINKEDLRGFKLNGCSCTCTSEFNATVVETVERLEVQMKEMTILMSECEAKKTDVENELKEAIDKIWVLRDIVRDLEAQIEDKSKTEIELKNIATQLEDKINFELKENEDLRNKLIALQGCEKESQYQEVIRQLESENQKLKVSSELIGPDGVLKQVKTQLSDFEKTLEKRTKDLEALHTVISTTNCSSPSEDMSIRDQIRPPGSSDVDNSDLPLEQLARLKDKLIRHARAEDAAMKRIRDLEMQIYTAKQDFEEIQTERDVLQEQLSEQHVIISSLQVRLDEQRLRVESAQKQSNASFEHKIYELRDEIQELKDTVHSREVHIQELNNVIEQTNRRISDQQKQLNCAAEIEKQIVEQFQAEINKLKSDNKDLSLKFQENAPNSNESKQISVNTALTSDFLDSLLNDKNASIERLKAKLNEIEGELKFYSSLNITKEELIEISRTNSKARCDVTSMVECTIEPDQLRKQEQTFDSFTSGQNFDLKKSPNHTVYIASTFREKHDKNNAPFLSTEISSIEKHDSTIEEVPIKSTGDSKHVRFDDETTKLNLALNDLQNELKLKDETIAEYQNNLEEIRKKLEFSFESVREKTDTFSREIQGLQNERKNLQVELAEVKMKLQQKSEQFEELEKDSNRKDKMFMNLTQEKRNLESKIEELMKRMDEFKSYEQLMTEKNKEIYNLEQQLAEQQTAQTDSLKQSLLDKEDELNKLRDQITQLENNLEKKLKEMDDYGYDYENMKMQLELKTELLKKSEEEKKELQKSLEEKIELNRASEHHFKNLISEHTTRVFDLEILLNEYKMKEIEKSSLILQTSVPPSLERNEHLVDLITIQDFSEISKLKKELNDKDHVINEKNECIKRLTNEEITKLKKELSDKELIIKQNNILIEQLNKEVHHFQEYLNEKDKIINQMTEDSGSLHTALEQIQSKMKESGNVVDLKKRLREEQNLSTALYEELKFLKKSVERYQSCESTDQIETLVLLKETIEKEKLNNQELLLARDTLLAEYEKIKQKLKSEEELVHKLKQLLEEEKHNSNMIQIQDANIIESMRLRLEALLENENLDESLMKYKKMLDEERVNANMIHIKDANTIETLKMRIDELLRREHDQEKLVKIERRIREELEQQLMRMKEEKERPFKLDFAQQHNLEGELLKSDGDAGHLFGKYLKAESYRKALVFQKRYLIGLLATYQKPTKAVENLNCFLPRKFNKSVNKFRAAAYAIISISRMQYIVRRWHTGKRIGGSMISKRSQVSSNPNSRPTTGTTSLSSKQTINVAESRPWSGRSPPSKERPRRQERPLGNTIQETIQLAPLEAPALLSQYIERFDSIQQRLGLAIDRTTS